MRDVEETILIMALRIGVCVVLLVTIAFFEVVISWVDPIGWLAGFIDSFNNRGSVP